ncbi:MAG: tRNA (adenosine(37)-N6)-threonylcarbamoyltransferase complex transferase subunit TsaD [Firmicutes bacterium]|nr:tRNA (adenosine(37)-N6)-threonylcarbamoyltransferase complex transferase subunit TsaD [Bacillota bacterium]
MYYKKASAQAGKLKSKEKVTILAVETSCDETSAAVVVNGRTVLSNVVASQIEVHKRFGGVVPEVASRNHIMCINNVVDEAIVKAGIKLNDIDAIAVTYGAGLVGALLVGVSTAKAFAYALGVPLIAVNHIKAHIAANYVEHSGLKPPFICLVVSGGHTAIVKVTSPTHFELLGQTQDDAIGECYDKVARVLGLGYPGGPIIERTAAGGAGDIVFVRQDSFGKSCDTSFSGLKTAVINYINSKRQAGAELDMANICASFQAAACNGLIEKTVKAAKDYGLKTICLAGGVAANKYLRNGLAERAAKEGIEVLAPTMAMCTDNAAMIGALGYFNLLAGVGISELSLKAEPNIELK